MHRRPERPRKAGAQPYQNTSVRLALGGLMWRLFFTCYQHLETGFRKKGGAFPKAALVILPQKSIGEFTAE